MQEFRGLGFAVWGYPLSSWQGFAIFRPSSDVSVLHTHSSRSAQDVEFRIGFRV